MQGPLLQLREIFVFHTRLRIEPDSSGNSMHHAKEISSQTILFRVSKIDKSKNLMLKNLKDELYLTLEHRFANGFSSRFVGLFRTHVDVCGK
jgi:hypothetical protein